MTAMKRCAFQALMPVVILGASVAAAQVRRTSPEVSSDKTDLKVEHVSFASEDGALIFADLYGSGDRGVVLAHGGQFTKESWQPQAQRLSKEGYRVVAFDFRGFGKSHGPGESDMRRFLVSILWETVPR